MSQFKIEIIHPESTLEGRALRLPRVPPLNFNLQHMSLLTYDLEYLLGTVADFLGGENENIQILRKTLKVLGNSLSDRKLSTSLEKILKESMAKDKRAYQLMIVWSQVTPLIEILRKFTPELMKDLVCLLFECFFLKTTHGEGLIKQQLPLLLSMIDQRQILNVLKDSYLEGKQPLAQLIDKCRRCSQKNVLSVLVKPLLGFALEKGQAQLQEIVRKMSQYSQDLSFVIEEVPNAVPLLTKQFKSILSPENVLQQQEVSPLGILRKSSAQEWLENSHNFWETVDRHFVSQSPSAQKVLGWGQHLAKEGLFSQCIAVKYLYRYFEGETFAFDLEDRLVLSSGAHESYVQVYRSIGQCHSLGFCNVMSMNVSHTIKHWPTLNPLTCVLKHKGLIEMVEQHRDAFENLQKEYGKKNKKMQLAFSALTLQIKESKMVMVVSFQQLRKHLEENQPLADIGIRKEYRPFEEEKTKEEPRKDHNIIVEARLVRLLKRSKEPVTAEWLRISTGYEQGVVDLGLKRLCNKGMAETNEEGNQYVYLT